MFALTSAYAQISSKYFTLTGEDAAILDPRVDNLTAREVFHLGINHVGAPAEKVVLRRYLEEALAQVRALQAKQRRESTFGSVRQLAAHIRELADAELRTVPGYREERALGSVRGREARALYKYLGREVKQYYVRVWFSLLKQQFPMSDT
jgi:hypothetical protein